MLVIGFFAQREPSLAMFPEKINIIIWADAVQLGDKDRPTGLALGILIIMPGASLSVPGL
jgi:hypothetical protein